MTLPQGASYHHDFLDPEEEADITRLLDEGLWDGGLRRRVQHFGYRYDYKARTVTRETRLGPLPAWLATLGQRLVAAGHFEAPPDQVIANEYLPGQGISAHIDCEPCFDGTIVSVSLLSRCEMIFRPRGIAGRTGGGSSVILEPRSALVLKDEARYLWTHEIPARKSDNIRGERVARSRRISLTFRKVVLTR
ncbi:alpha-ketoglutarate-dependent dioxygenase AlkB [Pseudohoeflea suaedae]|uniref:Alpha-ketoglutarate-dependent dioxygenase AlkB n=1 Tax=Pseudohoeflea suaedae TaxID=877384 RepID=A0A4R5PIS4_9HYPH|nr:alpha-ketoglutarate-dependent dioxygenase AlkB [Pseudohoeflea suaedae]TDH35147.1 alpha-ketoglutarate-dependent dioxygenase AlkB [Pseudohoeflea suaedae]